MIAKGNGPRIACLKAIIVLIGKVVYRTPFLYTKISKLIVFQFELLHRRLATNTFLTKINIKDNEQCTFCQKEKETLIHLFWTCSETNLFWQDFKQWLTNRTEFSNALNLSPSLVLGLKPDDFASKASKLLFLSCQILHLGMQNAQ